MAAFLAGRRREVAAALFILVVLAILPFYVTPFQTRILQSIAFATGLALAWNLLGGFAGYGSFGHTVFVGLSAFVAAHVAAWLGGGGGWVNFMIALTVGTAASAILAFCLAAAVLRLRGVYFAIATLGVGEVVAELVNNVDAFKGAVGVLLPSPFPSTIEPELGFYYLFFIASTVIFIVSVVIRYSRIGYGLISIREDEDTARMLAVPTERYKTFVFVLSGAFAGALGVIYAYSLGYITTSSVFRSDFSLFLIVYCMLGGLGTLTGPIIGAAVMVWLTQVALGSWLDYHLMATGIILVLLVVLLPGGLIGAAQSLRRRFLMSRPAPLPASEEASRG